jgi:protein SCO1/2
MKNHFVDLRWLLSLMTALGLVCSTPAADAIVSTANKPPCCAKEVAPGAPLSDRSLYQLDSSWTNDAAAPLTLATLRGRPQVVSMFFATCQFTCPVLVNDMKRIEAALPASVRTNVGFVLVSFDTERDTPEALADYRKIHRLPSNWTLLRGAPDDVLEFANLLGIKFKKDLRGQFSHSNVITVLDSSGEIVLQVPGLNRDVAETVRAIEHAKANGPVRPGAQK